MRKIYFAVYGSGLGHATRVMDISRTLGLSKEEMRYSCFGQGLEFIRAHDRNADTVECPALDVEWAEDGGFSSRASVSRFPLVLGSFLRQVAFEARSIRSFNPKVTVSESRLSAVLAAKSRSCPSVTMLNQFKVLLPPRFRQDAIGPIYERIAGDLLGLMWSLSDQVLVTDLPPPNTIGEANVEGTDVSGIVRYVGFTTPPVEVGGEGLRRARGVVGPDRKPVVFFQISGPDATKRRLIEVILKSSAALSREAKVVVSFGYQGGSEEPKRLSDGTIVFEWCPIKDELFALAEVLVARAGHRTIGQCIDSGKPAVLVPIQNHSEQLANASKFQKMGLGISLLTEDLTPERLTTSVLECLREPRYKKRIADLMLVSMRYRGIQNCAEIISSYA